ncbi:MAG: hypothetical protein NTY19_08260 [Planctomycetota bacterium]|nr:hypothetical protein [Planctomycetota bacterium]
MSSADLRPVMTAGDQVTPAISLLRVIDDIRGTDELVEFPVPPNLLLTRLVRFFLRHERRANFFGEPLLCCLHLSKQVPILHWHENKESHESDFPERKVAFRREEAIKYLRQGRASS